MRTRLLEKPQKTAPCLHPRSFNVGQYYSDKSETLVGTWVLVSLSNPTTVLTTDITTSDFPLYSLVLVLNRTLLKRGLSLLSNHCRPLAQSLKH